MTVLTFSILAIWPKIHVFFFLFVYTFVSRVVSVNNSLYKHVVHLKNKKRCCSYKWNRQYYLNCKIAMSQVCEIEEKESVDAVFTVKV